MLEPHLQGLEGAVPGAGHPLLVPLAVDPELSRLRVQIGQLESYYLAAPQAAAKEDRQRRGIPGTERRRVLGARLEDGAGLALGEGAVRREPLAPNALEIRGPVGRSRRPRAPGARLRAARREGLPGEGSPQPARMCPPVTNEWPGYTGIGARATGRPPCRAGRRWRGRRSARAPSASSAGRGVSRGSPGRPRQASPCGRSVAASEGSSHLGDAC